MTPPIDSTGANGRRPSGTDWPAPGPDAAAHSERVTARIREAIDEADGVIGFDRFMELALYAPGLGYYSAGARKFGAEGDFITAPDLSPLFGRCLARQCGEVLEPLGSGDILEFGPGTGALAAVLLAELERLGNLPDRYYLLEVSADLRQRQAERLGADVPHLMDRIVWLDAPPGALRGCVLANEVLDALPVRRFRIQEPAHFELGVGFNEAAEGFVWRPVPADAALEERISHVMQALPWPLPPGYTSELCPGLAPWTRSLAEMLTEGAALLLDYGYPRTEYYQPDRTAGTLKCHYRHRLHDNPFLYPGLQDITAHVDFTAVAEAADAAGLRVAGYTTQAQFLLANGLTEYADVPAADETLARYELAQQAKRLTLPGEMGEAVKVMALTRGLDQPLQGFGLRDLRSRL